MISQTTIDKLKELPLLQVVTRYSDIHLKKAGPRFFGLSPWTAEKTPSFTVHPGKNIYKDFSSGKGGGNAIDFVMDKEQLNFLDAVKSLASQWGIEIEYSKDGIENIQENLSHKEIQAALQWALSHFCANDLPESFAKRQFPENVLDEFKIGYAKPLWSDVTHAAMKAGFTPEILLKAGLVHQRESGGYYDYFRDRIMFPIFNAKGDVIAFTGRDAETSSGYDRISHEGEGHRQPKYINSPDTTYNKSAALFGLYQAIKSKKSDSGIYLVEGPTDVMRMFQYDLDNTVAPCSSTLTEDQAKLIRKYTDTIIIVPDNDCEKVVNAGIVALDRNAETAITVGLKVRVLIPGNTKTTSANEQFS